MVRRENPAEPSVAGPLRENAQQYQRGRAPDGSEEPFSFEHGGEFYDGAFSCSTALIVRAAKRNYVQSRLPLRGSLPQKMIDWSVSTTYRGSTKQLTEAAELCRPRTVVPRLRLAVQDDAGGNECYFDPFAVLRALRLARPGSKLEIALLDGGERMLIRPADPRPSWVSCVAALRKGVLFEEASRGFGAHPHLFPLLQLRTSRKI